MKSRILIVDDNNDNRYLLETLLKGSGYTTSSAKNGVEALELLRAKDFDLIITDILMPTMDGFQLCKECKQDSKLRDIAFIFYTATYTDDKDERFALTLGADRFVRKPLEPAALATTIAEVLDSRKPAGPVQEPETTTEPEREKQVLMLYNQRLVEKLENKMLDLEAAQTKYENLWRSVSDLIFILDSEHRITDINHSKDMLGYERDDVLGKEFGEFLDDNSRTTVQQHFERIARKPDSSRDLYELTIVRKDSSELVVELNISTIHMAGQFLGTYCIARDMTARKKAERDLKESASELRAQKRQLQQKNAALKEILAQIEAEKIEIQKQVSANVERFVLPGIAKLRAAHDPDTISRHLDLVEAGLRDLTSAFGAKVGADDVSLTPREVEICNMIRNGIPSKEIADLLHVSLRTVETHRNRIRKKLGISHQDVNLTTYLQKLE